MTVTGHKASINLPRTLKLWPNGMRYYLSLVKLSPDLTHWSERLPNLCSNKFTRPFRERDHWKQVRRGSPSKKQTNINHKKVVAVGITAPWWGTRLLPKTIRGIDSIDSIDFLSTEPSSCCQRMSTGPVMFVFTDNHLIWSLNNEAWNVSF